MIRNAASSSALIVSAAWLVTPAQAVELRIIVSGLTTAEGEVGCALHRDAGTFPMDPNGLRNVWVVPGGDTAECRFPDVTPGDYAVAVSHDLNGNRITDTNFIGLPTEDWGVSNNVRPTMRAPRFEEAAFTVGDAVLTLTIEVDR